MSGPDWYRWYPGKWLAGTLGLTNEQRGVYIQIINVIYDRGECPADEDYLMAVCNCHRRVIRRVLGELLALGKITKVGANFEQTKAKHERNEAETFLQSQRNRALKGWQTKRLGNANGGNAISGSDNHNHSKKEERKKEESRNTESFLPRTTAAHNGAAEKTKRGSRLPREWRPDQQDVAEAARLGLSRSDAEREADRFRDYWIAQPGQRGVKLDWPATWRNWCRKAAASNRGGGTSARAGGPDWGLY